MTPCNLGDKPQALGKKNVVWAVDIEEFPIMRMDSIDGIISG